MKPFIKSLLSLSLISLVIVSCKKDDDAKPEAQIQLEKLAKSWTLTSASLDGTPRTSDFTGVVLTLSGSFNGQSPLGPYNYSFAGTFPNPSPWPRTNTWSFADANTVNSIIIRKPDDAQINYSLSGDGNTLTLSFNYADGAPGFATRTKEVSGSWEFVFATN